MKACWLILAMLTMAMQAQADSPERYAIYYADKLPAKTFLPFDLVVFDSDFHPPLARLIATKKTLLGYISLGEVERQRRYYRDVKNDGLLLNENKNWPGSYYVDMRDKRWSDLVIERIIPTILAQGFTGVFLDTLDDPIDLEQKQPTRYQGMTAAAASLVKAIRQHYPHIPIMVNRGYDLLPQIAGDITMELGESVFTDYNFTTHQYGRVAKPLYDQQVTILNNARRLNPDLRIYTLDYWNDQDPAGIAAIYAQERENGFTPYVATIALDKVIPEP